MLLHSAARLAWRQPATAAPTATATQQTRPRELAAAARTAIAAAAAVAIAAAASDGIIDARLMVVKRSTLSHHI